MEDWNGKYFDLYAAVLIGLEGRTGAKRSETGWKVGATDGWRNSLAFGFAASAQKGLNASKDGRAEEGIERNERLIDIDSKVTMHLEKVGICRCRSVATYISARKITKIKGWHFSRAIIYVEELKQSAAFLSLGTVVHYPAWAQVHHLLLALLLVSPLHAWEHSCIYTVKISRWQCACSRLVICWEEEKRSNRLHLYCL